MYIMPTYFNGLSQSHKFMIQDIHWNQNEKKSSSQVVSKRYKDLFIYMMISLCY